jgi:1,4-alpha-glucan branching enzyme
MLELEEKYKWLPYGEEYVSLKHNEDQILAFERGCLLFVFNFHPT